MRRGRRLKWTHHDGDVLPCWVAEMDFPIADAIREALIEQIEVDGVGYPPLPIDPRLREAFVQRQQARYGWTVDPGAVYSLVNVLQGVDSQILLHSEPGEGVVLLTPIYGPFHQAVDGAGRLRIESRLVARRSMDPSGAPALHHEIDFDDLERRLDSAPRPPRLLLLSHPHNPSGRVFTRAELERLAELAERFRLVVVSDEIWADLTLHRDEERSPHLPFASLAPEIAARTVTLSSATKAFNIAGLTVAVAVFGSPELKRRQRTLPPHLIGHSGPLDSAAAITAWTDPRCETWLGAARSYLRENRELALGLLAEELPAARATTPEGSYLMWLDCRALELGEEPFDFFLREARVAFSDGREFAARDDDAGRGHVRLNLATSALLLEQILRRCGAAVRRRR